MKTMTCQKRTNWKAELQRVRRRRKQAVPMAVYGNGRTMNPAWAAGGAGKGKIISTGGNALQPAKNGEDRLVFFVTNNN